jgi:hypothetical protein
MPRRGARPQARLRLRLSLLAGAQPVNARVALALVLSRGARPARLPPSQREQRRPPSDERGCRPTALVAVVEGGRVKWQFRAKIGFDSHSLCQFNRDPTGSACRRLQEPGTFLGHRHLERARATAGMSAGRRSTRAPLQVAVKRAKRVEPRIPTVQTLPPSQGGRMGRSPFSPPISGSPPSA